MNPFRITEEEYNVEKKNFLKSLIFLIWKGANGEVKKQEEEIMDITIEKYYSFYFHPFNGYSDAEKKPYVKIYYSNFKSMKKNLKTKGKRRTQDTFRKIEKLQQLVEKEKAEKNQRRKSDTKHSHRKRLYTTRA